MVAYTKRPGIFPVSESDPLLPLDSAEIVNQAEKDETNNEGNFEEGRDELHFTVDPDEEQVGGKSDNWMSGARQ